MPRGRKKKTPAKKEDKESYEEETADDAGEAPKGKKSETEEESIEDNAEEEAKSDYEESEEKEPSDY